MHNDPAVLVVDDDKDIVELATAFLTRAGFRTFGTTDPEEAIRLVQTDHSIKIVLSDVSMPKLTGPEVIRRAFKFREDVRVLFMSGGFSGVQFRQTDRFLRKPLRFEHVVEEIRTALNELPDPVSWQGPERRRPRAVPTSADFRRIEPNS
jgi:DNA-binding NtrC family response regulator